MLEFMMVMTDIMQSPVSLREKIAMLNAYAGGCFVAGDYEGAMNFLQKAEELDAHDNMTLRNLAMLAKEMGQQEKALSYAGRMNGTDFVLLKQLL
jgi:Flp pilus assembly protein TadD